MSKSEDGSCAPACTLLLPPMPIYSINFFVALYAENHVIICWLNNMMAYHYLLVNTDFCHSLSEVWKTAWLHTCSLLPSFTVDNHQDSFGQSCMSNQTTTGFLVKKKTSKQTGTAYLKMLGIVFKIAIMMMNPFSESYCFCVMCKCSMFVNCKIIYFIFSIWTLITCQTPIFPVRVKLLEVTMQMSRRVARCFMFAQLDKKVCVVQKQIILSRVSTSEVMLLL